ncbi:MAG: PPC domain-containing DNA-binding protein [Acetivibrionales bacterium]|jgi:predicted DNA-binding protein with PD1-like motif
MSSVRFHDVCGKCGKVVAARLLPNSDLLTGIEEVCKKNGIDYALVNCFGSFSAAGYMYLVPNEKAKVGAGYGDVVKSDGPVEFLSGVGVVCKKDGACDIHFHGTMCNKNGTVFGGHLVKGQNPTLTTVDLVIIEVEGVEMLRQYDEETDLTQFYPKKP